MTCLAWLALETGPDVLPGVALQLLGSSSPPSVVAETLPPEQLGLQGHALALQGSRGFSHAPRLRAGTPTLPLQWQT